MEDAELAWPWPNVPPPGKMRATGTAQPASHSAEYREHIMLWRGRKFKQEVEPRQGKAAAPARVRAGARADGQEDAPNFLLTLLATG